MRFRPVHRPDLWQEAIRSRTVVAENRARTLEGGRRVTRSLVSPIAHEGALVGLIHLSDATTDYDADDCDLLERVTRMVAPMMHARLKRDMLTPRELEVMEMLVSGMSQKQIAQELNISVQTAAKHRARVLDKLKLQNDVELVHLAMQMRRPAGLASV
jgi:DNA-binding CsgD family transcriptional regulator